MLELKKHKILRLLLDGYLKAIKHPTADLMVLRYTEKTVAEGKWQPETLAANTLIVDGNYNVISRPFPKVFDISEHHMNPKMPDMQWGKFPMLVTEKIDGTMGVLYFIDDEPFIATPEGFDDENARVANQILTERYMQYDWDRDCTYVFEIVHPGNKHRIDYAESRNLVLLAKINTKDGSEDVGEYMTLGFTNEFMIPEIVPSHLEWREMLDHVQQTGVSEGVVVRFADGLRVKIHTDAFLLSMEKESKQ